MPFIFQYVVWKLKKKKKALKEYSKKEEVFVHREALFLPSWVVVLSLTSSFPPQKVVKPRETVRNQRL